MNQINVVTLIRLSDEQKAKIAAIDPCITFIDCGGWFDGEIIDTWPEFTSQRYLRPPEDEKQNRAARDAALADSEVVLGGWPYPKDIRARTPKLKWFHQGNAGASNLRLGDLWDSGVMTSTSRGHGNTLPMAEYVMAGIFHFARGLNSAVNLSDRTDARRTGVEAMSVAGKTLCVVGAGGIGQQVGRLGAAVGMRVVGTRRNADADLPEGFSDIAAPDQLHRLLAESHFVAVCVQFTEDTENLMDAAAFAAMKPRGVLINVARGEIVDEAAMLAALDSGHLQGAVLDVYVGEFDHPPGRELWDHPRIVMTPHSSGRSDTYRAHSIDAFCENLEAYVKGEPLSAVVDWQRGY